MEPDGHDEIKAQLEAGFLEHAKRRGCNCEPTFEWSELDPELQRPSLQVLRGMHDERCPVARQSVRAWN